MAGRCSEGTHAVSQSWSASIATGLPSRSGASAAEPTFESERALEVALKLFRKGSADFADCLHVALTTRAGEQPLWTFDKGACKIIGAQLLARA